MGGATSSAEGNPIAPHVRTKVVLSIKGRVRGGIWLMRGQNPFSFEIPHLKVKKTVCWSENLESFESEGGSHPCDPSDDLEVVEVTGNDTHRIMRGDAPDLNLTLPRMYGSVTGGALFELFRVEGAV